jgi:hypothetical protein
MFCAKLIHLVSLVFLLLKVTLALFLELALKLVNFLSLLVLKILRFVVQDVKFGLGGTA